MDKLELKIENGECDGRKVQVVEIYINDQDLKGLIKEYERPFSKKEGVNDLSGGYGAMTPEDFLHWFVNGTWPSEEEHPIYACGDCGEVGCWPMIVSVSRDASKVRWLNFNQPHRGLDSKATHWDYGKFPSFEFYVENYDVEVQKIEEYVRALKYKK